MKENDTVTPLNKKAWTPRHVLGSVDPDKCKSVIVIYEDDAGTVQTSCSNMHVRDLIFFTECLQRRARIALEACSRD